jgi:hypothetical protein
MFGRVKSKNEKLILSRCRKASLLYTPSNLDPCFGTSIIETNISCCFCYDRYPNFILDDDKWLPHRKKLGVSPQQSLWSLFLAKFGIHIPTAISTNRLLYWFCALSQNNTLLLNNWTKYDVVKNNLIVVTGKFGYNNQFGHDVNVFCNKVKKTGLIEDDNNIYCYTKLPTFILQDTRFAKHLQYLTNPDDVSARGGGYWFHKSVLLRYRMENEEDGKYIIWADNDRFNFFRRGHFQGLIIAMEERSADFAIEELPRCPEKQWSKEDMLQAFHVNESGRESNQVNANAMVIRNSPKMRRFVDAWVDCVSDWHMVSDDKSIIPNRVDFVENRHDQSILGLLVKQFLSNESVIGPPVRPYHKVGTMHTYHMAEKQFEDVKCPFKTFYESNPLLE